MPKTDPDVQLVGAEPGAVPPGSQPLGSQALAWRWLWILLALALASYACLWGNKEFVQAFAGREKVAETLGAVAFLVASCLYLAYWRRHRSQLNLGGAGFLAIAAFLFVAFGEEASWGQHWLRFETPEAIKAANAQQETNLHNLWLIDSYATEGGKKSGWAAFLLNSNRLFDGVVIAFFALLPWLARWPAWSARWVAFWGSPQPPGIFLWALGGNWLLTALAELTVARGNALRHLAVSEVREFNYALLFLAAAAVISSRKTNLARVRNTEHRIT